MTKKLDEMADCWAENSKKEVWGTNYTIALSHGFKAGFNACREIMKKEMEDVIKDCVETLIYVREDYEEDTNGAYEIDMSIKRARQILGGGE